MGCMRGFIVHPTYRTEGKKTFVQLFGRLENGESFLTEREYVPYLYIRKSDLGDAMRSIPFLFEETQMRNFAGEELAQIFMNLPYEVGETRKMLLEKDIPTYEADIRFAYRFMFDFDIKGFVEIEGEYGKGERVDRYYRNPHLKPTSPFDVKLTIVSLDIETDERRGTLLSIALYPQDECLMLGKHTEGAVTFISESALLEGFRKRIVDIDPDVILGWNLTDFDLRFLEDKFRNHNLKFDIGRYEREVKFRTEAFHKTSTASIAGRMVLDAMYLMRDFFVPMEDYKLDTASKNILGDEKIKFEGDVALLWEQNPSLLSAYNKKDACLTYKIVEKEGLVELATKISGFTGMQLDRVKASIASLDSLYLKAARKKGIVCPSVSHEERTSVVGGLVKEPLYGIYDNVCVFDFHSLYPSIMATFNIDPQTFTEKETKIKAPNNVFFEDKPAILPEIILDLLEKRAHASNPTESFAIKIIMNSFFGVLGNPHCRFYNAKIANAITAFGRYFLEMTKSLVEERGYRVIYGDTDSIFVVINSSALAEVKDKAHDIETYINDFYDRHVAEIYGRKNYLKLEFEKLYSRFYLPKQRHEERGAKKRYAGLLDDDIDIVGLEYVRRDWTPLAKKFQYGLLDMIFRERDYESFIKDFVSDLHRGTYDDLLVYKKGVRKELSRYTKTTPPHVKAARKITNFKERTVEYVMTKHGPEPLKEGVRIDYEHYKEKQLAPIADSLLTFLGKTFHDVLSSKKQTNLDSFL